MADDYRESKSVVFKKFHLIIWAILFVLFFLLASVYKKYEQDDDEENTIDAVHTDSQWLTPNKQVEDTLKVDVEQVRDPSLGQSHPCMPR